MEIGNIQRKVNIVRDQERPIKFLISRVLWRTGLCEHFSISRPGFDLRFWPSSLSAAYWIDPTTRKNDEEFVRGFLDPGDVFVDVGANIGNLALAAASVSAPDGEVHAIEPHPRIHSYLERNIQLNKFENVHTYNVAVGAEGGEKSLTDKRSDDTNRLDGSRGEISVRVSSLDQLLAERIEEVKLLKIDVEGYEPHIIQGSKQILSCTDAVYFEVWQRHLQRVGWSASELLSLLREHGFQSFRNAGGTFTPVDDSYQALNRENLLAVRNPANIEDRLEFTKDFQDS